jgi:1,4-dihydroxy-2-naphthoyl-CoA hydrolase
MYKFQTRINFFDADAAGVLFFGKIFEICHRAYEEFLYSFNPADDYFSHPGLAIPIIHTEADYLKTVKPGKVVFVNIVVEEIRSSSFSLNYIITDEKGEKLVKVKTVHVFIDKQTQKKKEIPLIFREKLELHI